MSCFKISAAFCRAEGIHHQQQAAGDDAGVGDVEVGPVVVPAAEVQLHFEEVGHVTDVDSIEGVADRSTEY